ncbi:PAS domain-containing sensor histidine kinase [Estrella lausannensis]|uniref:Sensory/regulatory protein RpfC n=1 Tax=Estrella lausannensis TaxID=483423 RepID=A0A0H5DQG4_9BACT|nr:ATP-binding protein [Estrella lausannensis]CRX38891.1 Signal transduction histidine kinase [Estrella lausannensis]
MEERISAEVLRNVLDYSLDGILLFGEDGSIQFVNKTGLKIIQAGDWSGLKVDAIFPDFAHLQNNDFKNHIGEFFESVVKTKSGAFFSVEARFGFVQSEGDRRFYAIFRDISREKKQEKYLHISNILLDLVSLSLSDFIKEQNRETVGAIFNALLRDILTVTSGTMGFIALKNKGVMEPIAAFPKKYEESFKAVLLEPGIGPFKEIAAFAQASIEQKKPQIGEVFAEPLGSRYALCVPLLSNDDILGVFYIDSLSCEFKIETMQLLMPVIQAVIVIHEAMQVKEARERILSELKESERKLNESVNELKLHEEELIHAKDQALTANRAKSSFLANMSHEIRTPLNVITGMTELLYNTNINDRQERFIQGIRDASEILLTLVNQILDLSKIEVGEFKLEESEFNLADLVKEILLLFYPKASQKNLRLNLFFDPKLLKPFIGDSFRLKQILINLLGNSLKFTATGFVELRVTLKRVTPEKEWIRFEVIDSGIGMDEETKAKLFTPFTQGDSSTTRQYGGTGLGLAICKKLVGLMQGDIQVLSTKGAGTTFFFDLPMSVGMSHEVDRPWRKSLLYKDSGEPDVYLEEYLNFFHVSLETEVDEESFFKNALPQSYDLIFVQSSRVDQILSKMRGNHPRAIYLVPPFHDYAAKNVQTLEYPVYPSDVKQLVDSLETARNSLSQ